MNMKLSYRDKVIFIVVIVILILVAGFFLLIKPKFEDIDLAKYNLETVQKKRDDIDARIAMLPGYINEMKETAKLVGEKQELFMPEQHPYMNEIYVREALSSTNARFNSFYTSYTSASNINKYTVKPQHILAYENKMMADLYEELPQEVYNSYNNVALPTYPNANIGVTTMTFSFENDPSLATLRRVIDRIKDDEKAIVLNAVSLNEEADTASCSITLYSINPLNVEKILEETDDVKPLETPAE